LSPPPARIAAIAQLVEHIIRNDGVGGSNPSCGTSVFNNLANVTVRNSALLHGFCTGSVFTRPAELVALALQLIFGCEKFPRNSARREHFAAVSLSRLTEGSATMESANIPHEDFTAGFLVGYQAIMGTHALPPLTPLAPLTLLGMTRFLMGVRAGLETAGIDLND
jgi:hypothetical protein